MIVCFLLTTLFPGFGDFPDVTVFEDRERFQAAAPVLLVEEFNEPFRESHFVDFGPFFAVTEITTDFVHTNALTKEGKGNTENTVTFTFDFSISAFGVDIFGFGTPSGGTLSVATNTDSLDIVLAEHEKGKSDRTSLFFGVVDCAGFTSLTFTITTLGDNMDWDTLEYSMAPATCPGDTNCDGVVDVEDLIRVVQAWGTADPDADVNEDGLVNVDDLIEVVSNWGPC